MISVEKDVHFRVGRHRRPAGIVLFSVEGVAFLFHGMYHPED